MMRMRPIQITTYVWNDGNEVYYVHDVFQEGQFTWTRTKPHYELEREPNLSELAIMLVFSLFAVDVWRNLV